MTATEPSKNEERSAVPVPYSVLGAGWVVLIVGSGSLAPGLTPLALMAGPAVMAFKFFADAERFARIKDNPPPIEYKFHAPGVYAAVDQALKTLPGYFDDVNLTPGFQNINPQPGMPMHLEYTITKRHPDENNKHQKPSEAKSSIYMWVYIKPTGNNSQLTMKFKCTGRRILLEEIIDHLMKTIDDLVKQHVKE